MKVFLLAGGRGSRLYPFTQIIPKALLPIRGQPVLAWVIRDLYSHGLKDIVVLANTRFEDQFRYHAAAMEKMYNINVNFGFREDSEQIGTAGEVLSVKDMVTDTFIVYYSDIVTDLRFEDLIRFHEREPVEPLATLAIAKMFRVPKGVVETDLFTIKSLLEKPSIQLKTWCGIGIFQPEILSYINMGDDFSLHVIPRALKDGKIMKAFFFEEGYLDIGDLTNYRHANEFLNR